MSDSTQVSIKELASKLKVSDALLKKFIKDFDIQSIREKKLVYVSQESADILKEIIRLRDAGKKNIEIKKLFKEAISVTAAESSAESSAEPPQITETNPIIKPAQAEPTPTKPKNHEPHISEEYYNEYISEQVSESPEESLLTTLALVDSEEAKSNLEEAPEDLEEEEEEEERDSYGNKQRRRQFSFRFIQRQIANDFKRIGYIRHKLNRGKLSHLEKMHLEDSLDKRSRLLKGWTHLLRWVKN